MTLKSFAFFRRLTHLEKDKEVNRYLEGAGRGARSGAVPRNSKWGARVDSFIRLKNHYLKNALKFFTIFYAYDFMGQSLC